MNITLTPADALSILAEANQAGVGHYFTQITGPGIPGPREYPTFRWEPDCEGPELRITLRPDGTWKAEYREVLTPGVDRIQGYDHATHGGVKK